MAYRLITNLPPQFEGINGDPLAGGTLEFYIWNTTTPIALYADSTGTALGTSCTLNSLGQPQTSGGTACQLFGDTSVTTGYKIVRKDADGAVIPPNIGPVFPIASSIGDLGGNATNIVYTTPDGGVTTLAAYLNAHHFISVKDAEHGALGDGTTDDSAAFTSAIAAATRTGQNRIFVPPSSSYYSIENVVLASNITFFGGGQIRARGTTYPAFTTVSAGATVANITFEDIIFKRVAGDGSFANVIGFYAPSSSTHSNIKFIGTEFDGSGCELYSIDGLTIRNCYAHDSWYAGQSTADNIAQTFEVDQVFRIGPSGRCYNVAIEDNRFYNVNGALYCDISTKISYCRNKHEKTSASCTVIRFTINGIANIQANDNQYIDIGRTALTVQRNNVAVDALRFAHNITVCRNQVEGYGTFDNGTHPAIQVQSQGAELCRLVKVRDNIVDGNRTDFPLLNTFQGNGISLSMNADVADVSANQVYDVQGYGIEVAAQTGRLLKQVTLAHNIVAGAIPVNGGSRNACISLTGADFIQVIDNNVKNPGSATIVNASGIFMNACQKVIAKRNICLDDRGTPYMQYGINVSGAIDYLMADDNYAQGYTGVRPFNFGSTTAAADYGRNFWYDGTDFNSGQPEVAFSANDATPSVLGGTDFVTANALARTITNFDDGVDGQFIRVRIFDANTTLDFTGASLVGNNGVDYACASGDMIHAHRRNDLWYCTIIEG